MENHPHKSTTHEERFFHFTVSTLVNQDMTLLRYSHLTLFARKEVNEGWFFAFSKCSKLDQFSRKIGRQKAHSRYFSGERHSLNNSDEIDAISALGIATWIVTREVEQLVQPEACDMYRHARDMSAM